MAFTVQSLLDAAAMLAEGARTIGAQALAADLDRVVAEHSESGPAAEQAPESTPAVDVIPGAGIPVPVQTPTGPVVEIIGVPTDDLDLDLIGVPTDDLDDDTDPDTEEDEDEDEDDDWEDEFEDEFDDITDEMLRNATPRTLTLAMTVAGQPDDGLVARPGARLADELAHRLLPTLVEQFGDLVVGGVSDGPERTTHVSIRLTEDNTGTSLVNAARSATAANLFEATLPIRDAVINVALPTALLGEPNDAELADEIGMRVVAREFDAPQGDGHPVTALLDEIEERTGHRPQATRLTVTYRKRDGAELTDDAVTAVVNHPLSQAGLAQMGNLMLLEIEPGGDESTKVVRFGVLDTGAIDPAALALGAAAYKGTFDFTADLGPEVGVIAANARAHNAPVDIALD